MLWSGTMRERGFWQSMPCNQNCPCLLPLHKEVSSQQGRDCLRWSLIYYQISIYIYIYAICVKFLLWYCFLQPVLDSSWHKLKTFHVPFHLFGIQLGPMSSWQNRENSTLTPVFHGSSFLFKMFKHSSATKTCECGYLRFTWISKGHLLQASSLVLLNRELLVS